jgi:5,10-methenyltetrahydrofolate synthetase
MNVDKESLRSSLLRSINSLPDNEIQDLNFSLTNQLIKFFKHHPHLVGQIGASYLPFKKEAAPIVQELLRVTPVMLAYPILKDGLMGFALAEGLPKGGSWLSGPYHEVAPDWLLIPGVGFDLQGSRLGRGKGFYDRFLQHSPAKKIGLAWSGQLVEEIPMEAHDCPMDFIITENFCWNVKEQMKF